MLVASFSKSSIRFIVPIIIFPMNFNFLSMNLYNMYSTVIYLCISLELSIYLYFCYFMIVKATRCVQFPSLDTTSCLFIPPQQELLWTNYITSYTIYDGILLQRSFTFYTILFKLEKYINTYM